MAFVYEEFDNRQSLSKKIIKIFLILILFNFILTTFFIRVYKIQDSLIEGLKEGAYVLAHFYPLWSSPQKEDIVFVQDYSPSFWSLGKFFDIITLGILKQNSWGVNSFNKIRSYKIIAKEGDVISLDKNLIKVISAKGEENVYTLPKGAEQFFSFLTLEGRILKEKEFLGFLDKGTQKEYVHILRFFSQDLIKGKKWLSFSL